MSKPLTIVLAAGGTGGHMFPAIAVGDALTARGHTVIAATDGRGQRFGAGIETENVTGGRHWRRRYVGKTERASARSALGRWAGPC